MSLRLAVIAVLLGTAGCSVGSVTGEFGSDVDAGAADSGGDEPGGDADPGDPDLGFDYDTSGPWLMPPWLVALADGYSIGYDDPPPWEDGSNCGGSFLAGTQALSEQLQESFPQITEVGGYSCRPNTANSSQTSVHGTGRAMDLMIPTAGDGADNESGDQVANYLVYHAEELGVQLVIWDRSRWIGVGMDRLDDYGGPIPHIDHLHVELTVAAAE